MIVSSGKTCLSLLRFFIFFYTDVDGQFKIESKQTICYLTHDPQTYKNIFRIKDVF